MKCHQEILILTNHLLPEPNVSTENITKEYLPIRQGFVELGHDNNLAPTIYRKHSNVYTK